MRRRCVDVLVGIAAVAIGAGRRRSAPRPATRPGRRPEHEPAAGHRRHAARRAHERRHQARRAHPLQARGLQPGRLRQGPPGAQHDRQGRGARRPHAGRDHPGADVRQHRHRHRHDRRRQGVRACGSACPSARAPSGCRSCRGSAPSSRSPRPRRASTAPSTRRTALVEQEPERYYMPNQYENPDNILAHVESPRARRSGSRRPARSTTSSPAWAPPARSWAPAGTSSRSSRRCASSAWSP